MPNPKTIPINLSSKQQVLLKQLVRRSTNPHRLVRRAQLVLAAAAGRHIAKGKVLTPSIGATRTAEDFVQHIAQTVDTDPDAGWIFIVDQLNIHKSESLVRLVAQRCQMEIDLGIKEKSGILQSMSTRAAFLSDSTHRIRFVYIPKHTSWLNQIECWFSILMRRFLKRSNFTSTDDLKQKILEFISYYNRSLAKPFLWKFQGYPEAT